jgi:hypothetical protein
MLTPEERISSWVSTASSKGSVEEVLSIKRPFDGCTNTPIEFVVAGSYHHRVGQDIAQIRGPAVPDSDFEVSSGVLRNPESKSGFHLLHLHYLHLQSNEHTVSGCLLQLRSEFVSFYDIVPF